MPSLAPIQQMILDLISDSHRKISPLEIENSLISTSGISRKMVRDGLRALISAGELKYSNLFGTTWVEKSFNRPVRISRFVVVKPENIAYWPEPRDIVIDLIPGISFGSGDHPTTRLSVQGIEYALAKRKLISNFSDTRVLDIGTGSGVLAIAALKFGIAAGVGTDTDPCAISEARQNAGLNGLESRLGILPAEEPLEEYLFSMITANLRLPDIINLYPLISDHACPGAPIVLSGLRPFEIGEVLSRYGEKNFRCLTTSEEKNWSCLVLLKKP